MGTLPSQGCGFEYDGENEGHGGFLATQIVSEDLLPGWLSSTTPDVVIMFLGTNDVWSDIVPTDITDAFSTLVDQMRDSKEAMNILVRAHAALSTSSIVRVIVFLYLLTAPFTGGQVAQITPMAPDDCPECGGRVVALNDAIAEWAPTVSTETSPVTVVDCWTGYDTATDTGDGVHPNDSGNEKLADDWFEPLSEAISQVGG